MEMFYATPKSNKSKQEVLIKPEDIRLEEFRQLRNEITIADLFEY
jgi:hypothetical protein